MHRIICSAATLLFSPFIILRDVSNLVLKFLDVLDGMDDARTRKVLVAKKHDARTTHALARDLKPRRVQALARDLKRQRVQAWEQPRKRYKCRKRRGLEGKIKLTNGLLQLSAAKWKDLPPEHKTIVREHNAMVKHDVPTDGLILPPGVTFVRARRACHITSVLPSSSSDYTTSDDTTTDGEDRYGDAEELTDNEDTDQTFSGQFSVNPDHVGSHAWFSWEFLHDDTISHSD